MYRFHFDNCGKGVQDKTIKKLKNANQKKASRPIVIEIKTLKKTMPQSIVKTIGFKPGWYQLPNDQLNDYLSSLKVLNLGNLKE